MYLIIPVQNDAFRAAEFACFGKVVPDNKSCIYSKIENALHRTQCKIMHSKLLDVNCSTQCIYWATKIRTHTYIQQQQKNQQTHKIDYLERERERDTPSQQRPYSRDKLSRGAPEATRVALDDFASTNDDDASILAKHSFRPFTRDTMATIIIHTHTEYAYTTHQNTQGAAAWRQR